MLEIETKFTGVELAALAGILRQIGAERHARVFEENRVYDTPERELKARGVLLRLRTKTGPEGTRHVLTVKVPPEQPEQGRLKIYDEHETALADAEAMHGCLTALGYRPAFAYEKVRETYAVATEAGPCLACLDTLPYGEVLELEGTAASIAACATLLGLDPQAGTPATYHELNRLYRERAGLAPDESFVFTPEEKERLRALVLAGNVSGS